MLTEFGPRVDSPAGISSIDCSTSWQQQLKEAVRSVPELLRLVNLSQDPIASRVDESPHFPLRVPLSYIRRMTPGDANDPLLLQVLPLSVERQPAQGYIDDPLQEQHHNPVPGLVHKYPGRALLITTQACAVHCRYCFRQHFPYADNRLTARQWQPALDYLRQRPDIHEIILSGGDPLSLDNKALSELITALEQIPHLTTLRLHSRTPIVLPARVDEGLVALLTQTRLKTVLVLHANHAREIDKELHPALTALRTSGTVLLNQAVFLKGINDQVDTLTELSHALFDQGVLPYYLHVLDPVARAAHFDTADDKARLIWQQLQSRLPGYLLPRLVREVPGDDHKRWINEA
ncbi:EF-P beta-lysylation protein EpmB [Saccharospirillum impatiens]|uniref:EF-P beta-lysylation protein EpmB n=1 Tax=Saccharospirillum impatiens TaxID=169438 RepID=UPI00041FF26F|nr:EF-P beta-lysylation protein EpmB [Saccharospirillum impatiens]